MPLTPDQIKLSRKISLAYDRQLRNWRRKNPITARLWEQKNLITEAEIDRSQRLIELILEEEKGVGNGKF